MNKKLAFTLIELLVVIAVIGILSGLIVVSMSGTSQKATIAKAQIFSNSLRNSLMSDMVSQWKFDEASGTTAYDFWGGNNATLSGTVLPQITTAGCVYGNCLYLDGANSYLSVANVNNLKFSTGTASIWFKWSNLTKSYGTLFSISDKDSNRCMNVAVGNWTGSYDDESVGFFYLNSNWILQAFYRNGHFFYRDSNWHHLVFTVGSNYNYLYIDGQKKTNITYLSGSDSTGDYFSNDSLFDNFEIGTRVLTSVRQDYFGGSIDDFSFYKSALPIAKIKEMYCFGIRNLFLKGEITNEEYLSRINSVAINE